MRRTVYLSLVVCCTAMATASVAALPQTSVHAQCGEPFRPKCPPAPADKEKKTKPTEVPPTGTSTATPTPTATVTPRTTKTNMPEPTASPTPVRAVVVPPPSVEEPAGSGSTGVWLPLGGILFAIALGLGYMLRRRPTAKHSDDSAPQGVGHWLGLYHTFHGESSGEDEDSTFEDNSDDGRGSDPADEDEDETGG